MGTNRKGVLLTQLREVSSNHIDPTIGNHGHDCRHRSTNVKCTVPFEDIHEEKQQRKIQRVVN